ncbi:MAG: Gfo/Idh/MocA family oxidoreductase [Clostridia bacterium]|nr:Gfo/Idh/MocA family oxidoreductase [Clostridia bacterium]
MDKINIAIIGCGTICNSAHAPNYKNNEKAVVKYLVDIKPEKAEKVKKKFDFTEARIVSDYKEILNDNTLDAVSVCVPNYLHCQISCDCMSSGLDVLCEKPIAISYDQAKNMQETASKYSRILNIGVVNRFDVYVNELKRIVDSKKLGEIYHVYCSFRNHRSIPGMGGWFTTKNMSGGGVLIDWGVHFIDLILYVLSNPDIISVSGKSYCELGKNMRDYIFENMWAGPPDYNGIYDVDDFVTAFIRTKGATVSLNGAWAQNIVNDDMTVEFLGSKGGVKLRYRNDFDLTLCENGKIETVTQHCEPSDAFASEIDSFLCSVINRTKSRSNIDNVIMSQKIMDAIYESSEKNSEIVF